MECLAKLPEPGYYDLSNIKINQTHNRHDPMLNPIISHPWIAFALLFVIALLWMAASVRVRRNQASADRLSRLRAEQGIKAKPIGDPWGASAVGRRTRAMDDK